MVYFIYIYRPPSVKEAFLCDLLELLSENHISNNNLFMALGDLNSNFLLNNIVKDFCEVNGLYNLIKSPTCFKGKNPTLLDIALTNKPKSFNRILNIDIGLSDFHNYISLASRVFAPPQKIKKISHRRMKEFNEQSFKDDLDHCPFSVGEILDDIDDEYWFKEKLFMETLDKHAPSKTRTIRNNQVPYMNSDLRKAINQRNMWRGKHFRCRDNKQYRFNYVKLRNKVVKLRKISIQNYFNGVVMNFSFHVCLVFGFLAN